ncbi:sodium/potassium-transporting ATPase subunit beta-1 [Sitophilus oryzae]|uniref:Sodium/potassium-transporting ATPase subunit beta-1 n=1 Tax=Sitophilus oryzae TaxID=7048 RepID=A0A6J2X9M6_SITOR|nr:sodium/potassium-transporting ATPase subunit beta-1 [Sitophilus oryzae]
MVASKSEDNGGVREFQFQQKRVETNWQAFKRLIYDPSTNAVFGRTGKNWGQLLTFYAIFYLVLAALFAICMQGLFATLSDTEPKWRLERSLIGTNPGLGFRPISERTEEGSLIWYNMTNSTQVVRWVKLIDEFLEPYNKPQTGENYVNCDFDKPPEAGKVCVTDASKLGNCNRNRSYGYSTSSPCFFLKLNRIFDWTPDYYTEVVSDMPQDLQMHIKAAKSEEEKKQIWVSCNGQSPMDEENVKGFNYYPQGFAGYYYPYRNVKNYLSPIIAVEILNVTPNVIVSIECRAWAKNIEYSGSALTRAGSVQFEVQVDADTVSTKLVTTTEETPATTLPTITTSS